MARKKKSPIEEAFLKNPDGSYIGDGRYKDPNKGLIAKQVRKWKKK